MGKLKIVLISFLIFGLFIQSFGQSSIEYEKFVNKLHLFRQMKNDQKLSLPHQKLKRPDQNILKENPFYNYQQFQNSYFFHYPQLSYINYYYNLKHVNKQQIHMITDSST